MKNLILTLIFTLSIPLVSNASDKYEVEVFCQDVNVLLQKFDLHAKNIVNHRTTRTVEGGYFKRKQITKCSKGFCKYKVDDTPPTLEYAPDHPDALKNGYVEYPSYAVEEERANMIRVSK